MEISSRKSRSVVALVLAGCLSATAWAGDSGHSGHSGHARQTKHAKQAKHAQHAGHSRKAGSAHAAGKSSKQAGLDLSGKPRKGKASYYGRQFHGKKMADGTPMNPNSNTAASKTLPLGTTARITNLESGKSEVVKVRDRGPYVNGRIMDVTPKVADKLEMKKDGVAPVEVKPIEVPQPDGSTKPGAGATGK
jgi:rare lipoprotein A